MTDLNSVNNVLVIDIETTTTKRSDGKYDFSPYNSRNELVSVGWTTIDAGVISPIKYMFLSHKELYLPSTGLLHELHQAIANTNIVVAHNAKFDISWLSEAGFDFSKHAIHDTMIIEYVLCRGLKRDLTLKHLCEKYGISKKKSDLIDQYFADGVSMYEIPMATVEEYGIADVQSAAELYLAQIARCQDGYYSKLMKTIQLMNEFCRTLIDIERAGIAIDKKALQEVKEQFTLEANTIKESLLQDIKKLMGDTTVNLDSPQQLSEVLYSRRVKEEHKEDWIRVFNIGVNARGKPNRRPKMKFPEFKQLVLKYTDVIYKTAASKCEACNGSGKVHKIKKDGSLFAKPNKCKVCNGAGVIYTKTQEVAGFKMQPEGVMDATEYGFSTNKIVLERLIEQAQYKGKEDAEQFIEKCIRFSALSSYLSTFVAGVEASVLDTGILHPNFNQCITATGRLSSTNPNLQNTPREKTFPFRKVFVSRWADKGGELCDVDFSQLEFRAAVHLAKDARGRTDILNGLDIHNQTRDILCANGFTIDRQQAKSRTFRPLYGGRNGNAAEIAYNESFLKDLYIDIGNWHKRLQEEAIQTKMVTLETGRQYLFPDVERQWHGGSSHATMIVNYPVQGFATADIVPISIIRLSREMKQAGLKSLIVLTVHDSVTVDVYPGEKDKVLDLCSKLAYYAEDELKKRYNITMFVPLACEVKCGRNLMDMQKI